jgi:hypothetical protein
VYNKIAFLVGCFKKRFLFFLISLKKEGRKEGRKETVSHVHLPPFPLVAQQLNVLLIFFLSFSFPFTFHFPSAVADVEAKTLIFSFLRSSCTTRTNLTFLLFFSLFLLFSFFVSRSLFPLLIHSLNFVRPVICLAFPLRPLSVTVINIIHPP